MENEVIITAPSLEPTQNVSGVSSVVRFIIDNNHEAQYVHFEIGKKDTEKEGLTRLLSLAKAFQAWQQLLGERPEAIVHYSFPLSTRAILRDPIFIREAIRRGHHVLVHIHGGLFLTAEKVPFIQRHILKRIFTWGVSFVVLSEMEKELVTKRFGAKSVEVLPNCVELPVNENDSHNEKEEKLTLGYIGRIEENKGMKELLAACKQLKEERVAFRLEMAGKEENEGMFLPRFETLLGDDFHYCGVVSGQSKSSFFKRIDLFVMPSYFEGLPMALLECMSFGVVPVVTLLLEIHVYELFDNYCPSNIKQLKIPYLLLD